MKISTNQIVIAAIVAVGVFAVAVTHRAPDSDIPEPFESGPLSFQSLDQLAGKNLVGTSLGDADPLRFASQSSAPNLAEVNEPQARVAQNSSPQIADSYSLPTNELKLIEPVANKPEPSSQQAQPIQQLQFSTPSVEPSSDVQSYNFQLETATIAQSATNTPAIENGTATQLPTAAAPKTMATVVSGNSAEAADSENHDKVWKSNPFIRRERPSTDRTERSSFQTSKPDGLALPSLDFSSSNVAPATVDAATEMEPKNVSAEGSLNQSADVAVASATSAEFASTSVAAIPAFDRSQPVMTGMSEEAAQKAAHHIEYGKSLARRNATQAATQEFYSALRVLAQANDMRAKTDAHTQALRAGMLALKEAEDFMFRDASSQIGMDVSYVAEGHETQLLGATAARQLTATEAVDRYLKFAGEQFAICGGQNVIAAEALYCLGKLQSIAAQANPNPESTELAQSIVFHRAAMDSDPQNFRSANELGVLLARDGKTAEAEDFLKRSLITSPTPQAWGNLAKVHQRRGTAKDMDLAQKAFGEYQRALTQETVGSPSSTIQWMDPQQFIARSPNEYPEANFATQQPAAPTNPVMPASNREPIQTEGERTSFVDKINSFLPAALRR